MVISLTATTIGIMAAQIVAAAAGQWYMGYAAKKMKKIRSQARLDAQNNEFYREEERFKRSLQAQLEMEKIAHQERLQEIESSFASAFLKIAHSKALSNYPLFLSPYLIRKNILSFSLNNGEYTDKQPQLFCILSSSNNLIFNKEILPRLDQYVSSYINIYWNARTTHTICYYEGIWNKNVLFDDGYTKNLQTLISNAPIVMITPYFSPEQDGYRFLIKVNYWGLDEFIIQPQGLDLFKFYPSMKEEKKEYIANMITPWIVCNAAFFSDIYYWIAYKDYPILPLLLSKNLFTNKELLGFFAKGYKGLADKCIISYNTVDMKKKSTPDENLTIDDLVFLNSYHFPDQNFSFLSSVCSLTKKSKESESLIKGAVLSLAECRAACNAKSLSEIDVTKIGFEDMRIIAQIADLAEKYDLKEVREDIIDIVRRKVKTV